MYDDEVPLFFSKLSSTRRIHGGTALRGRAKRTGSSPRMNLHDASWYRAFRSCFFYFPSGRTKVPKAHTLIQVLLSGHTDLPRAQVPAGRGNAKLGCSEPASRRLHHCIFAKQVHNIGPLEFVEPAEEPISALHAKQSLSPAQQGKTK